MQRISWNLCPKQTTELELSWISTKILFFCLNFVRIPTVFFYNPMLILSVYNYHTWCFQLTLLNPIFDNPWPQRTYNPLILLDYHGPNHLHVPTFLLTQLTSSGSYIFFLTYTSNSLAPLLIHCTGWKNHQPG